MRETDCKHDMHSKRHRRYFDIHHGGPMYKIGESVEEGEEWEGEGVEGYISAECKVVAAPLRLPCTGGWEGEGDYFALSRQPSSKRMKIERYWQSSPHEASDKFQR